MMTRKYMDFEEELELFQRYHTLLGKCLVEFQQREKLLGGTTKRGGEYEDEKLNEIIELAYFYADQMEEHWSNVQTFLPPEQRDNVRFLINRK